MERSDSESDTRRSENLIKTHLERELGMILSLNETENLQLLMKCFFNEGLVMFDKEMKVFYKTKQLNVKTPERKLRLVWDKIL